MEGPGREKLLHWPSMVCWLLAPRPVLTQLMWSVVGSFLKFGRNSTRCQYGGGNVLPLPGSSLSQLFGVDHLSSRSPLHRLGEGQGRGGKRLPLESLLPHCDRCLTGASALDFGHPHVEWKAEHAFWAPKSTKSFLAHLEHYAAAWVHSATLRKTRPLNASTWGVAPRLSKTWSEKASGGVVAQRRAFSATIVPKWSSLSPPLLSPLRSQPRCPTSVNEDERVRISAPRPTWERFPLVGLHQLRFHQ